MKAISLIQPWATLLACGFKQIETRCWSTGYRGQLLVHASAASDVPGNIGAKVFETPAVNVALRSRGYHRFMDLPRGMVIGRVRVIDCRSTHDLVEHGLAGQPISNFERFVGNFTARDPNDGIKVGKLRYGFICDDALNYSRPWKQRGSLGIFEVFDQLVLQHEREMGLIDLIESLATNGVPVRAGSD